jgi:GDP/GTP exchange factor required for growth at low temperature
MKVAKDCKRAHTRAPSTTKPRASSAPPKPTVGKQEQLFGAKFAEATQKSNVEDEDSDVDLDFVQEGPTSDTPSGYLHDPANAHLTAAHVGSGLSPTRPASIPFSSFSILQRTEHAPGPGAESDGPFIQTTSNLPIHHNAISRAFVKTIGRLGRWKRVLNSRSAARTSLGACVEVSAFDLELNAPQDLLTVNGGVEHFLRMAAPPSTPSSTTMTTTEFMPPTSTTTVNHAPETHVPPTDQRPPTPRLPSPPPSAMIDEPSFDDPVVATDDTIAPEPLEAEPITSEPAENTGLSIVPGEELNHVGPDDSAVSIRSSSTDSLGTPLTYGGIQPTFPPLDRPQWQFDVVSIDDLDLSDTSSDHATSPASPPGLRRPPRRLPLRRDFEFVRRSDTVSSMGLASHDSITSNTSSVVSSSSMAGFGGNIAQWQMNALIDSLSNDEEAGDVEDALRRLEGQIHPREQREKASKVDGWVRTIQERMVAGDYEDEEPRFSDDEDDEDDGLTSDSVDDQDSASQHSVSVSAPSITEPDDPSTGDETMESLNTPVPTQTSHNIPPPPPGPGSPVRLEAKPAPEDAVPLEILQSRVPSRPSTASSRKPSVSMFAAADPSRMHRSFILNHQTIELAQHFAIIDRELFMGVKFEELVLDDWMNCAEVNVLDWAQYLKDRARWKAEKRFLDKTSALAAVRARFNLMANFTISEIVLTQPSERPVLVAKFIRIAWVCFLFLLKCHD